MNPNYSYSDDIKDKLATQKIVALESTIISHGLPWPQNIELALELESIVKEHNCIPATIAVIEGKIKIGLTQHEISLLAKKHKNIKKFSAYDLPVACGQRLTGSTTVSASIHCAHKAQIKVFATGGIGGVHRNFSKDLDISHDLQTLAQTPIITVASGAKSILDLRATVECLETLGVAILGWKTLEFPAFYYNNSGIPLNYSCESIGAIKNIYKHIQKSSLLIANPVPDDFALNKEWVENIIEKKCREAYHKEVVGKALTPFLLASLNAESAGKTLETNKELIRNNVRLASKIAAAL